MMAICLQQETQETNYVLCSKMATGYLGPGGPPSLVLLVHNVTCSLQHPWD